MHVPDMGRKDDVMALSLSVVLAITHRHIAIIEYATYSTIDSLPARNLLNRDSCWHGTYMLLDQTTKGTSENVH